MSIALPAAATLLYVGLGGLDESFSAMLTTALGPVTVEVDPAGTTVDLVLDQAALTIILSTPLRVRCARPQIELTVSRLRYDFATAIVTISWTPVITTTGVAWLLDKIVEYLRFRLQGAARSSRLGEHGYSPIKDPAPVATMLNVWRALQVGPSDVTGFVAAANRAGLGGFTGIAAQAWRDVRNGLKDSVAKTMSEAAAPRPELLIGLADVRLQRAALSFVPLEAQTFSNKGGTRSLRVRAAQPLTVALDLDTDLATLASITEVAGVSMDAAVAAAPGCVLRSLEVSGQVEILSDGVAMATMSGVRVTPDAVVAVTGLTLTDAARELLSVGGVDLIGLERTVGSVVAAGLALVRLVLEAGGGLQAATLIRAAPQTAFAPVLAAAVEGNRSFVIEPAVLAYAQQEIEAALTIEVATLLRRHVEEPLGTTLTDLLGRAPTVVIP